MLRIGDFTLVTLCTLSVTFGSEPHVHSSRTVSFNRVSLRIVGCATLGLRGAADAKSVEQTCSCVPLSTRILAPRPLEALAAMYPSESSLPHETCLTISTASIVAGGGLPPCSFFCFLHRACVSTCHSATLASKVRVICRSTSFRFTVLLLVSVFSFVFASLTFAFLTCSLDAFHLPQ